MPTRLLVGFAVSCICILGSRRMHMQMPTMLIVIKGHLPLRLLPPPHSLSFFLSLPLYLSLLVSLFLPPSPPSQPSPSFTLSVTFLVLVSGRQTADYGLFTLLLTDVHSYPSKLSPYLISVCMCLCPHPSVGWSSSGSARPLVAWG